MRDVTKSRPSLVFFIGYIALESSTLSPPLIKSATEKIFLRHLPSLLFYMQLQQSLVLVTRLLLAVTAKSSVFLSQGVSVGRTELNVRSTTTTPVVIVEMPDLLKQAKMLRLFQGERKEVKTKVHQTRRVQSLGLRN